MSERPRLPRLPAWLPPFVGGACALGLVLALGALATVEFGLFDIRASVPHSAFVSWAAHETFIHNTQRTARGQPSPDAFSQPEIDEGLRLYIDHCQMCHGGPATPRAGWTAGLNPPPPFLLDSRRRWTSSELHRVIADGVKMTAMPAWRFSLSDGQVWDLVAFLQSVPAMPPSLYVQARQKAAGQGGSAP